MKLETKAQIAKVSLLLLSMVASLFFLGLIILVLCTGLHINPFRETTTSFLLAVFCGLIGAAAVLVLLNVATNISLIADAKIAELGVAPSRPRLRTLSIGFVAVAIGLVCLIYAGTYLSKEKYLSVVRTQADDVLKENKKLLEEISALLVSGRTEDYRRICDISTFLKHQRSGLPELTVIYSGKFADKRALFELQDHYPGNLENNTYTPSYFACTANLDCDYLKQFFSGEKVDILQKYTMRDDKFYIYIPFSGNKARFVLLFHRSNPYGKFGSM